MLATLALVLLTAPESMEDLSRATMHELVGQLASYGQQEWPYPEQPNDPLPTRALREIRKRLEDGDVLDLTDWKTILLGKDYLHWRARWPEGEPFAVRLHLPALYQGLSIELRPRLPGWKTARAAHWEMMCGLGEQARHDDEDYQVLGPLRHETREVTFDVIVQTPLWGQHTKGDRTVERNDRPGAITIEVQSIASQAEILPRLADAEAERQIGKQLASGLYLQVVRDSERPTYVLLGGTIDPLPVATALCVDGVLSQDGRIVEKFGFELLRRRDRLYCPLNRVPIQVSSDKQKASGWSLKLRGVPTGALRNWEATHFWAGEVEVSLADVIGR